MKNRLISVIGVCSVLLLSGCVTGNSVRQLTPGMSRAEAIDVMGPPDGVMVEGQFEALSYSNRLMSGWSWDRTDYYVILEDGIVTQYGNGEVRQDQRQGSTVLILVNPFN